MDPEYLKRFAQELQAHLLQGRALPPLRNWEVPIESVPDWQKSKIDAACDFWEMQLLGIRL